MADHVHAIVRTSHVLASVFGSCEIGHCSCGAIRFPNGDWAEPVPEGSQVDRELDAAIRRELAKPE